MAQATSRRRRLVIATLAAVLVLLGAVAGYRWYRDDLPQPPAVDTSGREPAIVTAIDEATAAVRQRPRSGAAWGRLGVVLLAHDFEPEARVCLARAEALDPEEARWAYLNGRLVQVRDPEAALPFLRRAALLAHGTSMPRLHLAETLYAQGHAEEAEVEFRRALAAEPDNLRAHLGLARLTCDRGELGESLEHLQTVVTAVPSLRAARALLVEVHHRRGDREAEERELAQLATSTDQEWPDPYLMEVDEAQAGSPGQVAKARRLSAAGRQDEALGLLRTTVRDAPDSYRARLALGQALVQAGETTEAEEQLRAALALRADSFDALGDLGQLLQRQGKNRDAADCYRRVIALQPGHALAHFNLANCQNALGDRTGAIASLRTALRCKPELAWAHKALGRLLAEAGEDGEAVGHLEYVLRVMPDDTETKELLAKVRARRGGSK